MIASPTGLVPWPYRLLAVAALAIALIGFGWVQGAGHVQAQWDHMANKQTVGVAHLARRQAETTVRVVTHYVDRVKVVREKGDVIIKEVPVYVSPEADAACVLPRGFVRLHDAAAAGVVPDPARDADATAAGITLSAVAGTVADNYTRCHENAEQLIALQEWVREMKKAAEPGGQ